MTDREARRRFVWASVVIVSALTFATSYQVVARMDPPRPKGRVATPAPAASPRELPTSERVAKREAPVRGLVPAPAPQRRVVSARRTRAS